MCMARLYLLPCTIGDLFMSRAAAAMQPIGPVQVYWNNVRLGSPKSAVTIRHNKDSVPQKDEQTGQVIMNHKTGETCEIDIAIQDFVIEQMRYAYDQSTGYATPSTINTVNYKASTSTTFRYQEEQELTDETSITLTEAGFVSGTIKVFKSDFSNAPDGYTSGTDFTSTSSTGGVARISGGSITSGDTVIIEYNQSATCSAVYAGGERADFEAELKIVHELDDGKHLQWTCYRAKKIGATDIAINMATEYGGEAMTFMLLADLTKARGKQLFECAVEA